MRVHDGFLPREAVCANYALTSNVQILHFADFVKCFLFQIVVFANLATTTIMQFLHITLPTCNTVHNLHDNRLGTCAKFAHVALI